MGMRVQTAIAQYLESLDGSASPHTVRAYEGDLDDWSQDVSLRGIETVDDLCGYKRHAMRSYLSDLQERLARSSAARRVSSIINFLKFARARGWIDTDLWELFPSIRIPKRITRILSVQETFDLLQQPDTATWAGARDRALIEVLYGSALRVQEAVSLNWPDISGRFVMIYGKGRKERHVPLTLRALKALKHYKSFEETPKGEAIFCNCHKTRLTDRSVARMLKDYMADTGSDKNIHPHLLRHSCASHMMSAGADLSTLGQLLGHTNLATTERYLSVDLPAMMSEYLDAHPFAGDGGKDSDG